MASSEYCLYSVKVFVLFFLCLVGNMPAWVSASSCQLPVTLKFFFISCNLETADVNVPEGVMASHSQFLSSSL